MVDEAITSEFRYVHLGKAAFPGRGGGWNKGVSLLACSRCEIVVGCGAGALLKRRQ